MYPPPLESYAPDSFSLMPVNILTYYLTFQSLFSLFFSILRFDHEVKPIGRPKRVFPARGGFWGVGRSQREKSLLPEKLLDLSMKAYFQPKPRLRGLHVEEERGRTRASRPSQRHRGVA